MKLQTIIVFGVSAVGKTTMTGAFLAQHGGQRFSASELLKKVHKQSGESLRTAAAGDLISNQAALSVALDQAVSAEAGGPVLLDAHSVIDNDDGLVEIPVDVIEALRPSKLILLIAQPEEIVRRRQTDDRPRPARSAAQIAEHQRRAQSVCEHYSRELGVTLTVVDSGDQQAFNRAVLD